MNQPYLEEYFGLECEHCIRMQEMSKRLEQVEGVTIARFEVWHNKENMARVEQLDKENKCGGLPFFINTKTGKTLCGEVSYDDLVAWSKPQ